MNYINIRLSQVLRVFSLFLNYVEWFIVEGIVEADQRRSTFDYWKTGALNSKMDKLKVYGAVAFVGLALLVVIFALTGGYL